MKPTWDQTPMLETESPKIDDALKICHSIEDDLADCLAVVEGMNQKYNAPGRYVISMPPFNEDYVVASSGTDSSSLNAADWELEILTQLYGARSAQELDESYVDVRYKFIKMKLELDGTLIHCQRVADTADRQERVVHYMLESSKKRKKILCRH
ncbi:uncharacterized protein [Drosophila kikkawai]|uniref:Uncharacterized protein n=1 Tax=Drosophila kikkawai TaxID=30033 RepID=A0A6P4HTW1_DROKI|nr:uncharacterized protein LOC108072749 [Drosophila kikkawai]KAH8351481.1 hypothetical protein KR059_003510 [Drosophila kikkawai]